MARTFVSISPSLHTHRFFSFQAAAMSSSEETGSTSLYYSKASSVQPLPPDPTLPAPTRLAANVVLQPPPSSRRTGRGLLIFVPPAEEASPKIDSETKTVEPTPCETWAREGFCVMEMVVGAKGDDTWGLIEVLEKGLDVFLARKELSGGKIGVIVYEIRVSNSLLPQLIHYPILNSVISYNKLAGPYSSCEDGYGDFRDWPPSIPVLVHVPRTQDKTYQKLPAHVTTYEYDTPSHYFPLPNRPSHYDHELATLAQSRNLEFLKEPPPYAAQSQSESMSSTEGTDYASFYDAKAPSEQPLPLPNAQPIRLAANVLIQPPLTRRGGPGPGLLIFIPTPEEEDESASLKKKCIDPPPRIKWAEEGYCVLEATILMRGVEGVWGLIEVLEKGLDALVARKEFTGDRIGVISYERKVLMPLMAQLVYYPILHTLISHSRIRHEGDEINECDDLHRDYRDWPSSRPVLVHLPKNQTQTLEKDDPELAPHVKIHQYDADSQYFAVPSRPSAYDYNLAALAHSRSVEFLKKPEALGGPIFDLEAIWEEHTYYEFQDRSVAKTMATMVAEPYVNHIPTMTGGIGREALTIFYRDHFIFANPPDMQMELISRTTGVDRVVDEFIMHFTHSTKIDWLLPGVPPTGKKVAVPMMSVVNIRGDRVYHEHITWDQATVLKQVGMLPTHAEMDGGEGKKVQVRLPTAGVETTTKLRDKDAWESNEMFGPEWGVRQGPDDG